MSVNRVETKGGMSPILKWALIILGSLAGLFAIAAGVVGYFFGEEIKQGATEVVGIFKGASAIQSHLEALYPDDTFQVDWDTNFDEIAISVAIEKSERSSWSKEEKQAFAHEIAQHVSDAFTGDVDLKFVQVIYLTRYEKFPLLPSYEDGYTVMATELNQDKP